MKKLIFGLLFSSLWTVNLFAQEFSLPVSIFADTNVKSPNRTIVFGYDPSAFDSLEGTKSWFPEFGGEQDLPPASGDFDFRFTGQFIGRTSDLPDGSYVDIRRKPSTNSFTLQYEIDMLENLTTNAKIQWNNAAIPSIIQHITLVSALTPSIIRLDMKNTSSLVFPTRDSLSYYHVMILTVYYNRDIQDAVMPANTLSDDFSIYPNPMDSYSKLHFKMSTPSPFTLSIFDVTGKKVFDRKINALTGENIVELAKNDFSSHPGVYMIRITGEDNSQPLIKTQTLIVR